MTARPLALPISLLALLAAARPAAAQQPAPPLLAPAAEPAPSEVGSVVIPQIFLGALSTFVGGIGLLLIASATHSDTLDYAAVALTPALGSLVVCGVGHTSAYYEGSCEGPLLGGYAGALVLGLGLAYSSSGAFSGSNSGDSTGSGIGIYIGLAMGIIVGTTLGATMGWYAGKHRRGSFTALGPKAPPPAALAAWTDLRPRAADARAGTTLGVPLLSLRF
jgi:hypothetical protein